MPRFGRDDAGAWYATHRASAWESQLVGLAHDGARVFTHAAVATGWVETSDLLALADGAAVLFPFQGDLTLGGTTLTGGGAALLVVDGDGEVVSFARLPGGAPVGFVGPSEGALSRDGEGLVLTGLTNRLGLSGSAWLEPITADGALRGDPWNPGVLLGGYAYGAAAPIRPLATSWAAACNTWSTDVIAGLPIEQYGGWDNCVARVEPGGVRALETFGGPGDDAWWATATDGDRVFVGLASANPNGGFAGGRPVPAYYLVRAAF
jgi:hypothetical protein